MAKKIARLAALPEDYDRLGMSKEIALREDGHRTKGKLGEYEWWYFDGKMDDGSSLVIVYYTQPVTAIAPGYAPGVTFSLTKDGGIRVMTEEQLRGDLAQVLTLPHGRERVDAFIGLIRQADQIQSLSLRGH